MTWVRVRVQTQKALCDAIEAHLLELGAVSITYQDGADQPVLEPGVGETPLWDQLVLLALFSADTDTQALRKHLKNTLHDTDQISIDNLEDRVWEREWEQHYQPIQCAPKLWICPSWCEPPDPDAINLLLDPGLAFGTGTHPSTAMCLSALAQLPLEQTQVVDYGCGSGILGIAMLALGATHLIAVDNDPQALAATADNCARNGIDHSRRLIISPDQDSSAIADASVDILVANILAEPLIHLAPRLVRALKPGGILVLAGLIQSQVTDVSRPYSPDIELKIAESRGDWVCLTGTKSLA
jgi:ribosomal protein L11 methyltransferase